MFVLYRVESVLVIVTQSGRARYRVGARILVVFDQIRRIGASQIMNTSKVPGSIFVLLFCATTDLQQNSMRR